MKKGDKVNLEVITAIALGAGVLLVIGKKAFEGVPDSLLEAMATSIKAFEGWFPGSVSYRNNNPGNLKYAGQAGAIGQDERGHAIFESLEAGWIALKRQLEISFLGKSANFFPNMTLYEFFGKYAEANSENYAAKVANDLGVFPSNTLSEILENWG